MTPRPIRVRSIVGEVALGEIVPVPALYARPAETVLLCEGYVVRLTRDRCVVIEVRP